MTFRAISEGWLIISILSLLGLFFIWLEWKRKYKFREGRIVAIVIMIASLSGILLQPGFVIDKPTEIILLTHGYSSAKVDSLLKTGRHLKLLHTPDAMPFKGSSLLPSYHDLARIGNSRCSR